MELGPREVKQGQLVLVRRDTGDKSTVKRDGACQTIIDMLEKIQSSMFDKYVKESCIMHSKMFKSTQIVALVG